ncbi:MAG: hypothetical protein K2N64_07805 [Anaeroplasmataceae bacterium]|nr:hypothetical protein [Anaeroplasmataceae bacterium]
MKKIIALFLFLLSFTSVCFVGLNVSAESNSLESESIPVYLSTDFSNPLSAGCPKCKNNRFFNLDMGIEKETLYTCTKCRFQFIIKTVTILE